MLPLAPGFALLTVMPYTWTAHYGRCSLCHGTPDLKHAAISYLISRTEISVVNNSNQSLFLNVKPYLFVQAYSQKAPQLDLTD